MSRRVKDDFSKLALIFSCAFPCAALSQISGPIDYTHASENLAELFVLSTSHQAVRPTDDFGKFWGTYTQSENWSESYSTEYGLSLQIIPLNQTLRSSLLTFDVPESQIPKNIYVPRFHYMLGLRKNLGIGLNALYYPDWQTIGAGLTFEYTFLQISHWYTGILLNYGGAWKSNFMDISSGGVAVVETYATKFFEIYAGIKYIFGRADFVAPPNQQGFGIINYESEFGSSYLAGISFNLFRNLGVWDETVTFTGQVEFEKNLDPNYIAKLTLKVPSHRSYSKPLMGSSGAVK